MWKGELIKGANQVKVWTDRNCQGTFYKEVFQSEQLHCYPNPCAENLTIYVGGQDPTVHILLIGLTGISALSMQGIPDMNREIQVNVAALNSGIYLVKVTGNTINQQVKIIKK
jgi:hypothetical protein